VCGRKRDTVGRISNLSPGNMTKDWEVSEQMPVLEAGCQQRGGFLLLEKGK